MEIVSQENFMDIKKKVLESNFGKIRYNVRFDEIICKKLSFLNVYRLVEKPVGDIKEIKKRSP